MVPVYLLGAGFSRAISECMPMMDGLSQAVRTQLKGRNIPGEDTPVAANFEQWLSYLIERPPWLSPTEQENNRAGFFAVSNAVHSILSERQAQAVEQEGCPDWLRHLVVYWQKTSATVITFNYDNLVELAWRMYAASGGPAKDPEQPDQLHPDQLRHAKPWTALYPMPIRRPSSRFRMPPDLDFPQTQGMKLLKLHGSLSWRYIGPDGAPGDLIYETAGLGDFRWNAQGLSPCAFEESFSVDLGEPMIVPPTAIKSPYYSNRILQANWKIASAELATAKELVMMGLSLPPTDLLVSSMLATKLPKSSRITPVNRTKKIVKTVRDALQIPEDSDRVNWPFDKDCNSDPIPAWVNDNVPKASH